jgi:lycopene beta-cyclase
MDPKLGAARQRGPVFRLGTPGGAVKPSSGYAFLSIQRQAEAAAWALRQGRAPVLPPPRPALARWMDGVFLARLRRDPRSGPDLFRRLFERCPPEALLRFLGDRGRPEDYARVAASLPKLPMAGTALRQALGYA